MTNEILKSSDDDLFKVLKETFYRGAKDESVRMVLDYCRASGLDPMSRPVHIVPMRVKDKDGKWVSVDTVMEGIASYRIRAMRTGAYLGCSPPIFGPDIEETFRDTETGEVVSVRYPDSCTIVVKRAVGAAVAEFPATVYWIESYAKRGRTNIPNEMWLKRPRGQLAKCAEAAALRMGFSDSVGSRPTYEEMEGKTYEEGGEPLQSIAASRIKQLVAPETPAAEPNKPDLIAALRACKSMADLEKHRDAVSLLRGKEKTTAIAAWKEVKATLDGSTPPVDTEASAE